jgi:ATP-binding cassette subfamily F protein 3
MLCMDEPTNHLDVSGTEGLEQALKEFPGTIVLITHDRRLARTIADRVLWVEDGAIRSFDGGLDQCLQVLADDRSERRQAEAEARQRQAQKEQQQASATKAKDSGRIRNPLMFARLEERIMQLEDELTALQAAMLEPENYASNSRMQELSAREQDLKAAIAEAYDEWENWS